MPAPHFTPQAQEARDAGNYRRAGEFYMQHAYDQFSDLWREEGRVGYTATPGLAAIFQAALCSRLAGIDRRAELYVDHGLLVLEEAREYGFPPWEDQFRHAELIWPALGNEWEGHLLAVLSDSEADSAYAEASDQYTVFDDDVPIGRRLGWEGENEVEISVRMMLAVARLSEYPELDLLDTGLHDPSFTDRVALMREHVPRLVEHVLERGEWRSDAG